MDPTFPHLRLILETITARNNFRRIAGGHAEHQAATAWQEPREDFCQFPGCTLKLDWRKGDYARCQVNKEDNRLYVRYGDRRGVFCRAHYNVVGRVSPMSSSSSNLFGY